MTHDELIEAERVFINGVWDTLKGDHDDLRKQQIILHLYRAAIRVIAPAVLDEAAKAARDCAIYDGDQLINSDIRATCATAIRALKPRYEQ